MFLTPKSLYFLYHFKFFDIYCTIKLILEPNYHLWVLSRTIYIFFNNKQYLTCFIYGLTFMLCCFNSDFTNKINKITNKPNKINFFFAFLSVLYVILMIFFVNSLLKQQSTQLPVMKAVISHERF
jgi:hypothetical protein